MVKRRRREADPLLQHQPRGDLEADQEILLRRNAQLKRPRSDLEADQEILLRRNAQLGGKKQAAADIDAGHEMRFRVTRCGHHRRPHRLPPEFGAVHRRDAAARSRPGRHTVRHTVPITPSDTLSTADTPATVPTIGKARAGKRKRSPRTRRNTRVVLKHIKRFLTRARGNP